MYRSEKMPLQEIRYVVQRDYDKLNGVHNFLQNKKNAWGEVGDYVSFGNSKNDKVMIGASIVPGAFAAAGIASLFLGSMVAFQLIGPPETQAHAVMLEDVKRVANDIFNFSGDSFSLALKTVVIPLGVGTICLPKTLINKLADTYEAKTSNKRKTSEQVLSLIDDVFADKDDPSLKLPKAFLRKVYLRNNSKEFNIKLLEYLAYYRYCLKEYNEGRRGKLHVDTAYEDFINLITYSQEENGASRDFRENEFVNYLIDDYRRKEEEKDYRVTRR